MNRLKLRVVIGGVFVLYSVLLCYFLFFADYYGRNFNLFHTGYFADLRDYLYKNINFIPFATISLYIRGYLTGAVSIYPLAVNLIGNYVAFMPFGFFLPYFYVKLRKPMYFALFLLLIIISVEIFQLVLMTGVCDIDDIILNVVGAECVFLITRKIFVR